MQDEDTRSIARVDLADDLLHGAETIAEFLFGDKEGRRRVYHLAATSKLPVFRLGSVLCARRTVLIGWIRNQERRAAGLPLTVASVKTPIADKARCSSGSTRR